MRNYAYGKSYGRPDPLPDPHHEVLVIVFVIAVIALIYTACW